MSQKASVSRTETDVDGFTDEVHKAATAFIEQRFPVTMTIVMKFQIFLRHHTSGECT